jgi:putative SOS response-associated peptidase YedK
MNDNNDWMHPHNATEELVRYLVENSDLSPLQAKDLVAKYGTDREKLIEVARTMKAEG